MPSDNALAPLGRRVDGTTNPDYRGVYVFTNDLPVFGPDAPAPSSGDDLYATRRAVGTAEVVCYHHDPRRSMADLGDDEVTAVVTTWRDRTAALQQLDGVAHVHIFENRGAAVGTSNPHPHCQIYAGALVYGTIEREAEVAAEHHRRTGHAIVADVVERELAGPRVVSEGKQFFACVPWFRAMRTRCTCSRANPSLPSSTSTTTRAVRSHSSCATWCAGTMRSGASACRTCSQCTRLRSATTLTTRSTSNSTLPCVRPGS